MDKDIIPVVYRKIKGDVVGFPYPYLHSRQDMTIYGINALGESIIIPLKDYRKGKPCSESDIMPVRKAIVHKYGCLTTTMKRLTLNRKRHNGRK